ncbi:MAG TPA: hypothetical protein VM142_06170 [Acidimicrobiales bacterium]|nr:hypothetical protein [Acidimicrobiales bacterium]
MTAASLIVALHDHFARHRVPHAFGGALALNYYAEPRATIDVDVNVFVPVERAPAVVEKLSMIGLRPEQNQAAWAPVAGVRLRGDHGEVADLFFSIDEHYAQVAGRARRFPFGTPPRRLPFLSAEDLVVFKLSFNRDKDWVDIRQLFVAGTDLDLDYVEAQLIALRGPSMYPRLARLRALARGSVTSTTAPALMAEDVRAEWLGDAHAQR